MSMSPTYRVVQADTIAQYAAARTLIEEYAAQIGASMGIDLGFQNFAAELNSLQGMYGPPSGCLLLASREIQDLPAPWVGCCALRRFSPGVCEMKRLYIKPETRGTHLGRQLAEGVIAKARALGYRRMVLDTVVDMIAAQKLYRSLGFRETGPYYFNPMAGVTFMELDLGTTEPRMPRS
jgi:putative acetyltransferase